MDYDEDYDYYTCENNKKLAASRIIKRKSKTGYISEKATYICEDCRNCSYKSKCIRGNNCRTPLVERTKSLETSNLFIKFRKENLERIISREGCALRINRSIKAEGSFAQIKQDMGFRRFLLKGKQNVWAESILLAMTPNVNKLHNKIQSERTGTHLFSLKNSA